MGGWMARWEKSAELRTRKQHRCDLESSGGAVTSAKSIRQAKTLRTNSIEN